MKVTNVSAGPRGLNTKTGQVLVEPGQTIDNVELTDAEFGVAKASGWFDFDGQPFDPDKATVDELKAYLATKNVTLKGDEKKDDLVTLAKAS